jgi:hypothetical protein
MKNIQIYNWKAIFFYIVPFFSLYIAIILDYIKLSKSGIMSSRAIPLMILTIIGLLLIKPKKFNRVEITGSLFTLYMVLVAFIGEASNLYIYIATLVIWVVALYSSRNIPFKMPDILLIGYIGAIMCNIMAFLYITLAKMNVYNSFSYKNAIAGYNSIYYILLLLPFVFLIKNKLHILLFFTLPFYSFIQSQKTTCVLTGVAVLCYFFYSVIKKTSFRNKILLAFFVIAGAFYYFSTTGFEDSLLSVKNDVDSGGSGRTDIAAQILNNYFNNSSIISMIFGHGVDAVSNLLNIGAHNDFLETLYCFGLVGFVLYIVFLIELVKYIKINKYSPDLQKAFIISLIVFLFASLGSKLLGTQIQMLPSAIFWGLTIQASKNYENSTN